MNLKLLLTATLGLAVTASPVVDKRNSPSWAGTNNYFIQGIASSIQDSYISQLASDGVKVVRLWVTGLTQGACEKGGTITTGADQFEDQIGSYNYYTLDILDAVLVKLASKGIKAIISPHDGNLLWDTTRLDIYGKTYGSGYFYEQQAAFTAYDNRISAILSYQGKYSGQVWKNWHAAIIAFDLENEPMSSPNGYCSNNDPDGWFCGRANHMRSVLGANNPIKIASGGAGGDYSHNCNFISAVTNCGQIDMISVHRYAGSDGNWASAGESWINQVNGKLLYVEEWGISPSGASSTFPNNANELNSIGLPWLYWQIDPPQACSPDGNDGFNLYINSGVDFTDAIHGTSNHAGLQDWTGIVY